MQANDTFSLSILCKNPALSASFLPQIPKKHPLFQKELDLFLYLAYTESVWIPKINGSAGEGGYGKRG
jgi:hypothetical protein